MKSAKTVLGLALIMIALVSAAKADVIADQSLISPFAPKVPWIDQVVGLEHPGHWSR